MPLVVLSFDILGSLQPRSNGIVSNIISKNKIIYTP